MAEIPGKPRHLLRNETAPGRQQNTMDNRKPAIMSIPIYLINLDGSDARLHSAREQFNAAGLSFERVPAFDGRGLRIDQFPDYDAEAALCYMGRPLSGGEIGCYLSHLDCARRFLATRAPLGIVFEDDLKLVPGFAEGLDRLLACLAGLAAWDLVNIGANKHKIYTTLAGFEAKGRAYTLTQAHYFPMTTAGLIWSRAGAIRFVEEHDRIWTPIDNYLRHWQTRTGRGLAVWPPLVTTEAAGGSDINAIPRSPKDRLFTHSLRKHRRVLGNKIVALRQMLQFRLVRRRGAIGTQQP